MHINKFPRSYVPGASHLLRTRAVLREPGISRRAVFGLIPLVAGFAGGAATGSLELFGTGDGQPQDAAASGTKRPVVAKPPSAKPVLAGTVEWALWVQFAPEAEFLTKAGEIERVRLSSQGNRRLVPVFERLLETALRSHEATADPAGAIAVRCLNRLGADHRLEILDPQSGDFLDRPLTAEELTRALRHNRERRRR